MVMGEDEIQFPHYSPMEHVSKRGYQDFKEVSY
jgi:hypothetical protein